MDLKWNVGGLFDLSPAKWIFQQSMPEGLELKDVHSVSSSRVVVEAESDPAWLLAIVGFVKAHWLALTLGGIGLAIALGFLVTAIRVEAPIEAVSETRNILIIIAVIAGIGLVGYLAYKGALPKFVAA